MVAKVSDVGQIVHASKSVRLLSIPIYLLLYSHTLTGPAGIKCALRMEL